ncbi:MAG: hypothetical protein KF911_14320 [Pseudomonadales bacterium]|nr:hypothetical protein [Pseudomonadales bacterium]
MGATLPRDQTVADAHTPAGLAALDLPASFPRLRDGSLVDHDRCQPIGAAIHAAGLRGVRARSAQTPDGAGRELAWFPAGARSRARRVRVLGFADWFWA